MTEADLSLRAIQQNLALQQRDPAGSAYATWMRRGTATCPYRREANRLEAIRQSMLDAERADDPGFRGLRTIAGGGLEFV